MLLAHGLTFGVIAALAAVELYPYAFALSSFSLVLLLLFLFAIATLTFALAIAPFFRSALLASIIGPTLFFGAPRVARAPARARCARRSLTGGVRTPRECARARAQARRSSTTCSSIAACSSTA